MKLALFLTFLLCSSEFSAVNATCQAGKSSSFASAMNQVVSSLNSLVGGKAPKQFHTRIALVATGLSNSTEYNPALPSGPDNIPPEPPGPTNLNEGEDDEANFTNTGVPSSSAQYATLIIAMTCTSLGLILVSAGLLATWLYFGEKSKWPEEERFAHKYSYPVALGVLAVIYGIMVTMPSLVNDFKVQLAWRTVQFSGNLVVLFFMTCVLVAWFMRYGTLIKKTAVTTRAHGHGHADRTAASDTVNTRTATHAKPVQKHRQPTTDRQNPIVDQDAITTNDIALDFTATATTMPAINALYYIGFVLGVLSLGSMSVVAWITSCAVQDEMANATPKKLSYGMQYKGGHLLTKPVVNPVFWASSVPDQSSIVEFYKAISAGPYMKFLTNNFNPTSDGSKPNYEDGSIGKSYVCTDCPTDGMLTDSIITSRLTTMLDKNQIPVPTTDAAKNMNYYPVHFPAGISGFTAGTMSFCSAFCAYHSWFNYLVKPAYKWVRIYYGVMPYMNDCPAGCMAVCGDPLESEYVVASHEFVEVVTDPGCSDGWIVKSSDANNEVGDTCVAAYDRVTLGNGQTYTVQKVFKPTGSNSGECASPVN